MNLVACYNTDCKGFQKHFKKKFKGNPYSGIRVQLFLLAD